MRSCGIHQGDAVQRPKGVQRWPFLSICPESSTQAWQLGRAAKGTEFERWEWTGKQGEALK